MGRRKDRLGELVLLLLGMTQTLPPRRWCEAEFGRGSPVV